MSKEVEEKEKGPERKGNIRSIYRPKLPNMRENTHSNSERGKSPIEDEPERETCKTYQSN